MDGQGIRSQHAVDDEREKWPDGKMLFVDQDKKVL
jgi:hypothetical protein